MPLSSFTGLPAIPDPSEATPGLFDARYSVISQNLDQINSDVSSFLSTDRIHVSGSTIRIATPFTPASGTASGNTGEIVTDASYIYYCTSEDSWSRATLETF